MATNYTTRESTPVERLRAWALWMRDHRTLESTPSVEDVEAVLAMLPPTYSRICAGHNPAQLTEEDVGVEDGWRLLTDDEIVERDSTVDIHCWSGKTWCTSYRGDRTSLTYRTKRPPGYFLPKPKQRVPLTEEDIPAVCWIRVAGGNPRLVLGVNPNCVEWKYDFVSFTQMVIGWEYSPDRLNWKPCFKEINT